MLELLKVPCLFEEWGGPYVGKVPAVGELGMELPGGAKPSGVASTVGEADMGPPESSRENPRYRSCSGVSLNGSALVGVLLSLSESAPAPAPAPATLPIAALAAPLWMLPGAAPAFRKPAAEVSMGASWCGM